MSNIPEWVKVGAQVIDGDTVHLIKWVSEKTGRFRLSGDPQQYRPYEDHAVATGNNWGFYGPPKVLPATSENMAALKKRRDIEKSRNVIAIESIRLRNLRQSYNVNAILAEAAAIRARNGEQS